MNEEELQNLIEGFLREINAGNPLGLLEWIWDAVDTREGRGPIEITLWDIEAVLRGLNDGGVHPTILIKVAETLIERTKTNEDANEDAGWKQLIYDTASMIFSAAAWMKYRIKQGALIPWFTDPPTGADNNQIDNLEAPVQFKGIVLAYSKNPSNITLHWAKANTFGENAEVSYSVYISEDRNEVNAMTGAEDTPHQAEGGETFTFNEFGQNTTYYCKVIPVIRGEPIPTTTRIVEIKTLSEEIEYDSNAPINSEIIPYVNGKSLGEVITNGVVAANIFLPSMTDGGIRPTDSACVKYDSQSFLEGGDGFSHKEDSSYHERDKDSSYSGRANIAGEAFLSYDIGFEPELKSNVDFRNPTDGNSFQELSLSVAGKLWFTAKIGGTLSLSAKNTYTIPLLKRSITLIYTAGVPVYQEVTLRLNAEIKLDTSVDLEGNIVLAAVQEVEYGFRYNREEKFKKIENSEICHSADFDITVAGTVVGSIKIIPKISTSFYKATETSLTLIPSINLDSTFSSINGEDPSLEKCEVIAKADAKFYIGLSIFWLRKGKKWQFNLYEEPIFSLPDLKIICTTPINGRTAGKKVDFRLSEETPGVSCGAYSCTWTVDNGGVVQNEQSCSVRAPSSYTVNASIESTNPALGLTWKKKISREIRIN